MLSLITKTSLISCYCLSTCQQSSCRSTAPILHSFIVRGVIPMTKPFIVRCQSTSQHTEPASMLVVRSSCTDVLQLDLDWNLCCWQCCKYKPIFVSISLAYLRLSQSGPLKIIPIKAVIKRITYPSYSYRCLCSAHLQISVSQTHHVHLTPKNLPSASFDLYVELL